MLLIMALKFAVVTVKYRYDLWGDFFDQEYIVCNNLLVNCFWVHERFVMVLDLSNKCCTSILVFGLVWVYNYAQFWLQWVYSVCLKTLFYKISECVT